MNLSDVKGILNPQRQRAFVAITMELGIDRTVLHIHGPRRIRKKRLKRLFRRQAFALVVEALEEERRHAQVIESRCCLVTASDWQRAAQVVHGD
jgi:hypothetical protein